MNYLIPLKEVVAHPSGLDSLDNYAGQIPDPEWLCLLTRSRDSDCLTESNWFSALRELGGESDNVTIDHFGHWACGWWVSLSVRAGTPEHDIARKIADRLENYPVLDEEDFSQREYEDALDVWNAYTVQDRIEYIRRHAGQFDFRDYADLLGCVRGKYFSGYAGELIA